MSDQFDPLAPLLARKAELEAEAVGIQTQVIENRLRFEEVCQMVELIQRKGRRKPGPQAGTPRPMRVVEGPTAATEPRKVALSTEAQSLLPDEGEPAA